MPIGVDNSWSEEAFDAGFSIEVVSMHVMSEAARLALYSRRHVHLTVMIAVITRTRFDLRVDCDCSVCITLILVRGPARAWRIVSPETSAAVHNGVSTRAQAAQQSDREPNDVTFDVRGIDPAIANALRRILIAEVRIATLSR